MNLGAFVAAAAALVAAEPPAPPSATQIAAFESAMAGADYHHARRVAEDMVLARRRVRAPLGADPLLNGLLGRLALAEGEAPSALGYLEHADGSGVPERQRTASRLALAAAREQVGDVSGAMAALDSLRGETLAASEEETATIERARLLLASDPSAAIRIAQPLAERGWEAETIIAQAQSLLGNAAAARDAAERAWTAAARALPQDYAPLRVALVRAVLAAAAGDRAAEAAMLNAGVVAGSRVEGALVDFLPVCGERGVTPADSATFVLFEGSNGADEIRPVAATRPAVVAAFLDALAGRNLLEHDGDGPGGTLITVRCRPFVDGNYDIPPRVPDPWSAWTAEHGLYEEPASAGSLDDINALSAELDATLRSVGDDDPRLIPLRTQLARWLAARAGQEGDVEEWQVTELQRKAGAAIARLGGDGLYASDQDRATAKAIETASTPEEGAHLYRAAMLARTATLPLDQAYTEARVWLANDKDLPDEMKRQVVEALLKRFDPKSPDLRRRALLVRLGRIQKDGDIKAARASWSAAGVAGNICFALDDGPRVQDHSITDQDYPGDALEFAIEGKTVLDLTIGPDGRIEATRLLLSTPAPIFDAAIAAKLPGFKISPPVSGGKPRACRGFIQTIQWKMPDRDQDREDRDVPPFRAPEKNAT
ncbi:MAG TPA: energy transducer TonB [Allosphingosinicella sp.]|jgi:hypothetical protein|nr:energy transducer TonB [Allosphingosinicella sp.]